MAEPHENTTQSNVGYAAVKFVTFYLIRGFGKTMNLPEQINSLMRAPVLTRLRMILAMAVAVAADGLQLMLGPVGWAGLDQAIDFVAMVAISWIIGFHILLLPTFVVELIPIVEDLPTWTACTAAVIALRKRDQKNPPPPQTPPDKPVIDI